MLGNLHGVAAVDPQGDRSHQIVREVIRLNIDPLVGIVEDVLAGLCRWIAENALDTWPPDIVKILTFVDDDRIELPGGVDDGRCVCQKCRCLLRPEWWVAIWVAVDKWCAGRFAGTCHEGVVILDDEHACKIRMNVRSKPFGKRAVVAGQKGPVAGTSR